MWRLVCMFGVALFCTAGTCRISTEDIRDSATKFRDGMALANEGLKEVGQVDPFRIGKLLDENEELRTLVVELESRLAKGLPGVPTLTPETRVVFEIISYEGNITVDAWTGDSRAPEEKFINELLLSDRDVELDLSRESVRRANSDHPLINIPIMNTPEKVPEFLAKTAQAEFKNYLSRPYHLPTSEADQRHDIHLRFPRSGMYPIWLQVTPDSPSKNNRWHLKYRVVVVNSTSAFQVLIGDIRSDKRSNWEAGKALPAERIGSIRVHVPTTNG